MTVDASPGRQFSCVLVANRGEIALRIIRAARELGLLTVAVYTADDSDCPHVRLADRAILIPSEKGYLDPDALVAAALRAGAQAVHPGYGFLSENAEFAELCVMAGLRFIGPSPEAIRLMGDKAAARRALASLGLAVIPGYDGPDQSDLTLSDEARRIGIPLMIKACAGGGGRGMRRVSQLADFNGALSAARAEALAAFGSAAVVLERAVEGARHVEIQILADAHGNVISLGERDCSVQRRHQKLIEESPSPAVDEALRREASVAAIEAIRVLGYEGAGTLEYLLTADGRLLFIEMNTRLQVEHPVTEAVYGVDLVQWQFRIAAGASLASHPALGASPPRGHAIEVRLCAEDAVGAFIPQSGELIRWQPPPNVRIEHALYAGAQISPRYDSMIARLVSHGPDRETARRQMLAALGKLQAFGVSTNRDFLIQCLEHPLFVAGAADTGFVERHASELSAPLRTPNSDLLTAAACLLQISHHELTGAALLSRMPVPMQLEARGQRSALTLERLAAGRFRVTSGSHFHDCVILSSDPDDTRIEVADRFLRLRWWRGKGQIWLATDRFTLGVRDVSLAPAQSARVANPLSESGEVRSPMNAKVSRVFHAVGDEVAEGSLLVILEAMKIEHQMVAPLSGRLKQVNVTAGGQVQQGAVLLVIDPGTR